MNENLSDCLYSLHSVLSDHFLQAIPRRSANDLTRNELKVLHILCNAGKLNAADIIIISGIQQPNIVPVIRSLEDQHLISREQNEEDKRTKYISITEKGKERYLAAKQATKQHFNELTEEETETIKFLLERCTKLLG